MSTSKKNTFRFLIDLFLFGKAEMELILYVENWSLLLLLTVSTTIGKKNGTFPSEQNCSELRTKALMENSFQMIIFVCLNA